MEKRSNKVSELLHYPCYTVSEAAHYLRIPTTTLREWIQWTHKTNIRPLIILEKKSEGFLSFCNLVEAYVLDALRRTYKVRMPNIRKAIRFLQNKFNSQHPLAEQNFETDGLDIFIQHSDAVINVSRDGQIEFRDIVAEYLKRIVRDSTGIPIKLYPFTRRKDLSEPKEVMIDPTIAFGRPVIAGKGTPTFVIFERFMAGDDPEEIAHDYEVNKEKVLEAIRCEQTAIAA